MTYRELINELLALRPDQLDNDVSVMVGDEYYEVSEVFVTEVDDVLDADHPVIVLDC
jgi:hypothetical protein